MSENSKIEWTDATWNPVLGCDKVSQGCRGCYAIPQSWMKQHNPNPKIRAAYEGLVVQVGAGSYNWTGRVNLLTDRLTLPLTWKQPKKIFVTSLSDLFHKAVPDTFIDQVFAVMGLAQQHDFQVLTKRPERMAAYLDGIDRQQKIGRAAFDIADPLGIDWDYHWRKWEDGNGRFPSSQRWPLPNVWLGTSTEDQKTADERIPHLLNTPAAVRFLSCEPLLGPVDLGFRTMLCTTSDPDLEPPHTGWDRVTGRWGARCTPPLHWVIAGGESGPNFRPMDLDWARSLRDQCQAAGVAFNFKQVGGRTPKAGGRILDGRTWDQFPEPPSAARPGGAEVGA